MKDTIVFTFGRMSPPTSGHAKLVKEVIRVSKKKNADHAVWLSKTHDSKKNPLDVNTKVKFLSKMVPGSIVKAADQSIRTFIEVAKYYSGKYKNIVMVAGSDRVAEYERLLNQYNGKEFHFDSVSVESAGERDPDSDGITGISGTKMREYARLNDLKSFKSGTENLSDSEAHELMTAVRKGMKFESFIEYLSRIKEERFMEGEWENVEEAEFQGRKVTLNKPFYTPDGPKKSAVYVKNKEGKVIIVRFGDPEMTIKKSNPERRKSFRARHNCSDKDDPTTPGYWSCAAW